MLLLYILWDDWPIFMISASNEQLLQQLQYTLLKPDYHSWWISKMQSDTLEEWYTIKFCFKLGKNATETYGMRQTTFRPSCMNRASVFEWHKRFKEGKESVRDVMRGVGGVRKSIHQSWLAKRLGLGLLCWSFKGVQEEILLEEASTLQIGQWHFHQDNTPELAPCDFCLFPKLRGCRYETIEEMKEAVMKDIDTLTQGDFHGAFQKLLEWYKCIAAGGNYFEGN